MTVKLFLVLLVSALALLLCSPAPAQVGLSAFVNFEGSLTHPIRVSADGTRLYVLNTPDNRLSVFDLTNPSSPALLVEIPVGIEPVSVNVNPANSDEVWVVNQESDSISVVSISKAIVTDTIYCKDEPADVVFTGGNAFVSVARSNAINVFDATTHAPVKSIPLQGEHPRTLALSSNGATLYAAFALSGNHSTIIPANIAPPPPKPTNPQLPPAPQTGLIVDTSDPSWSWYLKYSVLDHDVVAIDTAGLAVKRYFSGVGTVNLGMAIRAEPARALGGQPRYLHSGLHRPDHFVRPESRNRLFSPAQSRRSFHRPRAACRSGLRSQR